MSYRNSSQSNSRKRKHNEVHLHELETDVKRLKEEYFELCTKMNNVKSKLNGFEKEIKKDISIQQKRSGEIDETINEKMIKMQKNLKNEIIAELTKIFEHKMSDEIEAALKEQSDKIENLKNTIKHINEKFSSFEKKVEDTKKNEISNIIPNKIIENAMIPVMKEEKLTEKQKEFSLKEIHIPKLTEPRWLVSEEKCIELHKFCQGQVGKFLSEFLPILYNLSEIITPLKWDQKRDEAETVILHFWKNSLSLDLIRKEIEKEHSAQRYKISRKLYLGLKNVDGVIMSNNGAIFECIYNYDKKKFIPKNEIFEENCNESEWQIPKELQKTKYEKQKDYLIVAKNDNSN